MCKQWLLLYSRGKVYTHKQIDSLCFVEGASLLQWWVFQSENPLDFAFRMGNATIRAHKGTSQRRKYRPMDKIDILIEYKQCRWSDNQYRFWITIDLESCVRLSEMSNVLKIGFIMQFSVATIWGRHLPLWVVCWQHSNTHWQIRAISLFLKFSVLASTLLKSNRKAQC